MMRSLLLAPFLVAIADPALLYIIYSHAGGWAAFLSWFVPILLGNQLILFHNRAASEQDPAGALASAMINPFARLMLWYPGPVTSVFGLLLLLPLTRRIALRVAMKRVMGGVVPPASGGGAAWSFQMGAMNDIGSAGPSPSGPSGFGGLGRPATPVAPDGLKRAEGRVVDESPPEKDSRQ